MEREAKIGAMPLQAKKCLDYQTLEGSRKDSALELSEGTLPLPTTRFQTSGLHICNRYFSVVLSHSACGALLWQP